MASVGTPKAGVFAEGQASIAAEHIVALVRGTTALATYDGRGVCYLAFGEDRVARVDVTFLSGQTPAGTLEGPSQALVSEKDEFGASRVRRWFDRTWDSGQETAV